MTKKRNLRVALIFSGLLMAGCSNMKQSMELQRESLEQQQAIQAQLEKLNARIDQLMSEKESSAALSERIEYLTSITKPSARGNAEVAALAAIPEPKDDSPEAVRLYIDKILATSVNQRRSSSGDTQVAMLFALGEKNLPPLLEALNRSDSGTPRYHLRYAITDLANENTKTTIIDSFRKYPDSNELFSIIDQKNWGADAKDILIGNLERSLSDPNNRYINSSLIQSLGKLNDPETYPLLVKGLVEKENRSHTYSLLSKMPDIDLDQAVLEAWRRTDGSNERERISMAALALPLGDKSALEYMVSRIDNKPGSSSQSDPRLIVLAYIDFSGTNDEIREWYFTNRDVIRFDADKGQFTTQKPDQ